MSKPAAGKFSWETIAEERIRNAQDAGAFDNLPGFGQPLPDLGDAHDDTWWLRQKLAAEDLSVLPPALELARDVARKRAEIFKLPSEARVREAVAALNAHIQAANRGITWGPPSQVMPFDVAEVVAAWQAEQPD